MENNHQKEEKTSSNTPNSLIEHHEEKKWIESKFTTEEEFVKEVEKVFTSLKDRHPFSLAIDMGYYTSLMEADVNWRIAPAVGGDTWSLSQVESALRVLASRQTPNVRETLLNISYNGLGDISAEVWKLLSKFNNLTYLNLALNKLSVISPLVCDLTHLQYLHLNHNNISAEGVVGVCELLKVLIIIRLWRICCRDDSFDDNC